MKPTAKFFLVSLACALVIAVFYAPPAQAQTLTTLHTFSGPPDGEFAAANLFLGSQGNLYGTTYSGGTGTGCVYTGCGTIFKVDSSGNETVLYNFCSLANCADGGEPGARLIADSEGNLYGTATAGGTGVSCRCGVVFKLDSAGKEAVLHSFTGGADGGAPATGLTRDAEGNFYGTTQYGGITGDCNENGCGVVFKLDTAGHFSVLYRFTGGTDGGIPQSDLVLDSKGNLYGTTFAGGHLDCFDGPGCGVVFKVNATGQETVLYSFTGGVNGGLPSGNLASDSAGNLYGTAALGGNGCNGSSCGVIYKINSSGEETVLYSFTGGARGYDPNGIIRDRGGNLYGATYWGGNQSCIDGLGCGVVFKLDTADNLTVLYTFTGGADGGNPSSGLISDGKGNGYGVTKVGGDANCLLEENPPYVGCGTVYKITP
jgi:uncharacterized repeat protein (TIGR03803 family)